ncbi:MAG TPA: ferritin-like domain-containing protein [Chitinophagaceae bacterium]|jgi:ferritin-like metal-binding protein YciE|nr:ferritin-like domain-containing protein [Chitinophagaceae bacterium]
MKQTTKNKGNARQNQTAATNTGNVRAASSHNGKEGQASLLEKFFTDQLKDIYYAEQQLLKAIPKMAQASTTEELEDAFNEHLKQTERHVKRLEKVFQIIGKKPEGKKCEAMEGLVKESETIIKETKKDSMTRDAALIIAAQKVEHYEIATYGGLVQLAITMGLNRAADILDKTLLEEEDTDALLTDIAETYINIEAEEEGSYSWQKQEKDLEETTTSPTAYSM